MSGFSDIECKIIAKQVKCRLKFREMFLKLRTNPHKHAQEAGYVFDPALQKFMSMKACQFEHFQANPKTAMFGLISIVFPMVLFGTLVNYQRNELEKRYRCGEIKYRDRLFKFV